MLPTYVRLLDGLRVSRNHLQKTYGLGNDPYGLLKSISAGELKLRKYFGYAQKSDLILTASSELVSSAFDWHLLILKFYIPECG